MKNVLKIFGMLLMSIILVTSCGKDKPDTPPTPDNPNEVGDEFNVEKLGVKLILQIQFLNDKIGYAFGKGDNYETKVLKTVGDNKWEVINENFNPEFINYYGNPWMYSNIIGAEDKIYSTKTIPSILTPDDYVEVVNMKTNEHKMIDYGSNLNVENLPPMPTNSNENEIVRFYSPSCQNGNKIFGWAEYKLEGNNGVEYYIYAIDVTTDKIVDMFIMDIPDDYKLFHEQNNYIGINHFSSLSKVHILDDNSLIFGPILKRHPFESDDNDEIGFFVYRKNAGWENKATSFHFPKNRFKITAPDYLDFFGSQKAGAPVYFKMKYLTISNEDNHNFLYKIADNGRTITPLNETEKMTNYGIHFCFDDSEGVLSRQGKGFWLTKDGGNTWTFKDYGGQVIAQTSDYYYMDVSTIENGNSITAIKRIER